MRIRVLTSLYPSPETPFEGIFAARKWEGLAGRGHDVEVVMPLPWAPSSLHRFLPDHYARLSRTPKTEVRSGIRVVRPRYLHLPSRSLGNAKRFAKCAAARLIGPGSGAFDAVVIDYAWPGAAAAKGLTDAGIPVVINGRGSDVLQVAEIPPLRDALAAGLRAASGITAVSQDLLDAMIELRGDDRNAALTPNGVDTERFCPGVQSEARERVGQSLDGKLVLVVGHLIPRKDPLLAMGAFHGAGDPDARLVYVGRGPLMEEARERAAALGIEDRVSLLGERPPEELVDWYRAADVMVLTSSREGRPNVVLEALSSGCPVLATNAGGTGELLSSERMLSTTRDPEALGGMLRSLLNFPPSSQELRTSIEHLTWKASLDSLERVLQGVTSPKAS